MKVAVHLQRGEADVNAVHVCGSVAESDEWNKAPHGFAGCRAADGGHCGDDRFRHWLFREVQK